MRLKTLELKGYPGYRYAMAKLTKKLARSTVIFGLLVCLAGGLTQYWRHSAPASILPESDNIVVIVVDTLRADHLPFYGYQRSTAPFLSSVAERSVVFERAFSSSASTAPAMASVFTSLLPSENGVVRGKSISESRAKLNPAVELNRIHEELPTLPDLLQQAGYRTYGISDNFNICPEMGFAKGFDRFRFFDYNGADAVNDKALSWLDRFLKNDRYFLYLHYMDPHQPYYPREPWYEPSDDPRTAKINAYDSEIRHVDERIKELFEHFGWLDNSLVIFLADHGEEFWDHGRRGHNDSLYTEVTRVPLFVYHRNIQPARIPENVHTYDVLPTLMSMLGQASPSSWRGRSFAPALTGDGTLRSDRTLYQELLRHPDSKKPPLRGAIRENRHLIVKQHRDEESLEFELYDLEADFAELKNIHSEDNLSLALLREKIDLLPEVIKFGTQAPNEVPIDKEALERLKTLGYIGN